jgi:hypothetical protein
MRRDITLRGIARLGITKEAICTNSAAAGPLPLRPPKRGCLIFGTIALARVGGGGQTGDSLRGRHFHNFAAQTERVGPLHTAFRSVAANILTASERPS